MCALDVKPSPQINPLHILLVEDNSLDVRTVKRALKKQGLGHKLYVAHDGLEALDLLRGKIGQFPTDQDVPKLILLDLNLPQMNGLEFLAELRSDKSLRLLVTVVLTTSNLEHDIRRAYENHVAGYIVKAMDFNDFQEDIAKLENYWSMCKINSCII